MEENAAAILPSFDSTTAACSLATGFQSLKIGIEYPCSNSSHTLRDTEIQGFYRMVGSVEKTSSNDWINIKERSQQVDDRLRSFLLVFAFVN